MASQPVPHQHQQPIEKGQPYCADPNCAYCKGVTRSTGQIEKAEGFHFLGIA